MKKIGILIVIATLSINAFAVEKVAQEETTPPPAEKALNPNQIPPITTIGKPVAPQQVSAPVTNKP